MLWTRIYFFEYLFWVIFVYTHRKGIASSYHKYCYCWCSVTQSCLTLCDPMDCSMPVFPVVHHLLELAQTHVHWVSDAIQPSHSLLVPSPPAVNLSQDKGLFPVSWLFSSGGQTIGASASASVLPKNIQGRCPLRLTGLISLLSKGLSRVFSSTTVWKHQFLDIQPSLWCNYHVCAWLQKPQLWEDRHFVSKVMSLNYNMLSSFVITFFTKEQES